MRIKETFVSFTGLVDIGRFAFFIDISNGGLEFEIKKIVSQAVHFPRVVLIGQPLKQRDEVAKFITAVRKDNPKVTFEIHDDGTTRPTSIGKFDDIVYNINVKFEDDLSSSNAGVVAWFNNNNANFIFDIEERDDIDRVNLFVSEHGISKGKAFLSPITEKQFHSVFRYAKYLGLGFAPKLHEMFWQNDGRQVK